MGNRFYIYILYSPKYDKYYIGYSRDPWRRLDEHNTSPLNTFTSKYRPWLIAILFLCCGEEEALRLERFIKRQKSKIFIERLLDPEFIPQGMLAQLVRVPHLRD